jgi:hypothetical protein
VNKRDANNDANNKVMEMVLEARKGRKSAPRQHPRDRGRLYYRAAKRALKSFSALLHPRGLQILLPLHHKPFIFFGLWRGRRGSNPRPLPSKPLPHARFSKELGTFLSDFDRNLFRVEAEVVAQVIPESRIVSMEITFRGGNSIQLRSCALVSTSRERIFAESTTRDY